MKCVQTKTHNSLSSVIELQTTQQFIKIDVQKKENCNIFAKLFTNISNFIGKMKRPNTCKRKFLIPTKIETAPERFF